MFARYSLLFKVKDGNILTDITSGASSIAGKVSCWLNQQKLARCPPVISQSVLLQVTDVVHKKGGLDLSSLWGTTRSDYLPCEDSGLMHQSAGG